MHEKKSQETELLGSFLIIDTKICLSSRKWYNLRKESGTVKTCQGQSDYYSAHILNQNKTAIILKKNRLLHNGIKMHIHILPTKL